ncbi:DMT family transporter [Neisseria sp. Ec49-e6-T10]|uniref:DMT family transporter n=1 Tax=Neisseria sp. Ec49-e6-T10 TaxID=3140744 RepID=UPI003EB783AB
MNKQTSSIKFGTLLSFLAAFGFSFKAIFVKLAYNAASIDAITLLMLRMSFSVLFLVIPTIFIIKNGKKLDKKDYISLIILGVIGYYGSSILDFLGLQYITAGLERLILFSYPTLTILIGILFMGKKFEKKLLFALALSYAGILLAFLHDLNVSNDIKSVIIGATFVFGSALTYAIYNVGAEITIKRLGAMKFSVLALLVSTASTQIHFFFQEPLSSLQGLPISIYLYCIGMALFSTVLPIFWQSAAIHRIGVEKAVMIGMLGPMFTIFFSWWLLGETISFEQILGTFFVVLGVFIAIRQ